MNTLKSFIIKLTLIALVSMGTLAAIPQAEAQAAPDSSFFTFTPGTAEAHFSNLQTRMKGFSVIVLLIIAVFGGIMAALGKTNFAINVGIGAIVLFGLVYIILLFAEGLA